MVDGKWQIQRAFTLIELLVVISIIGILAGIVLVSFTGAQKQARDTQRKSDLKQYQSSLESFANKTNGFYPSRITSTDVSTLCSTLGVSGACPTDPRAPNVYDYQSDGSGNSSNDATKYVLWSILENQPTGTYWVVCSTGKVGQTAVGIPPSGGTCPI